MKAKKTAKKAAKQAPKQASKTAPRKAVKAPAKPATTKVTGAQKQRDVAVPADAKPAAVKAVVAKLSPKDKADLLENLLALRTRLTGQMAALKDDSLTREPSDNTIEDGTDAFERQVSLNLASTEHEAILAIDDAIQRLEEGTYGVCGACGERVEKARLKALPFVRLCIKCQSETEKGKTRYRPISGETGF